MYIYIINIHTHTHLHIWYPCWTTDCCCSGFASTFGVRHSYSCCPMGPHLYWWNMGFCIGLSCLTSTGVVSQVPKPFSVSFCFIRLLVCSLVLLPLPFPHLSPSFPIFHHLSALVTSLLFVAICDLFPAKASLTRSTMSTVVSPRRQCRSRFRRRIPRMSRVEFRFCFSELFLNFSYISFPVCELAAIGRRFMYRSSCFLAFACGVLWIIVTGKQHEASIAVKRLTVMNQSWTFLMLCHIQCSIPVVFASDFMHQHRLASRNRSPAHCQHEIKPDLINSWSLSRCLLQGQLLPFPGQGRESCRNCEPLKSFSFRVIEKLRDRLQSVGIEPELVCASG